MYGETLIPELFAILAAITWGMQTVFIKKGLLTLTPTSGLVINLFVSSITLWLFTSFFPPTSLNYEAIMFFALGGAFGTFLGVVFLYEGIHRVGAALTCTLSSISPLFASFFAIILLGEKITLLIFLGTLTIILGVGLISMLEDKSQWKFRKLYIFLPILSALFWGWSDITKKLGMDLLNSPVMAAAIGTTTALACLVLLMAYKGEISFPINESGAKYFVVCGLTTVFSSVALLSALRSGEVILVSPLFNTSPLFSLLFVHVFLKKNEKVTPILVIGAIMTVAGAILVTIG